MAMQSGGLERGSEPGGEGSEPGEAVVKGSEPVAPWRWGQSLVENHQRPVRP